MLRLLPVVLVLACGGVPPGTAGDAGQGDAGPGDGGLDGGSDAGTPPSRCSISEPTISCTNHKVTLTAASLPRDVYFEVPFGTAPAKGWPTVLYFQGSFLPAKQAFGSARTDMFGQFNITLTVQALLDAGYAVVAPNALGAGSTFWQTNVAPWSTQWTSSADHALMQEIFAALARGDFGAVDLSRLYAMGISSGGFMTSRMAVSYPGKFRALAIHSGSYATCSTTCTVPASLPVDHPPTLFLHGKQDTVVPFDTMVPYRDALITAGREVKTDSSETAGHEWLPTGPASVLNWFNTH